MCRVRRLPQTPPLSHPHQVPKPRPQGPGPALSRMPCPWRSHLFPSPISPLHRNLRSGSRGRISHYLLPAPWEEDEIRRDRVEPQSVSLSWREPIPAGGPGANNTEYEIRYYEKVSGTFPMPTSQQEPFSGFPGIPPPHPSLLSCLALQSLLPLLDSAPGPPLSVFSPLLLTHS